MEQGDISAYVEEFDDIVCKRKLLLILLFFF